jgi:membrane fusion protein, macrolide-specific efflux system
MSGFLTSMGEFFSVWRYSRIVFTLIAILGAMGIWKLLFSHNDNADKYVTAQVERGDIQNLVNATGILQPRNYVDVGAQVSGQLKKLYVEVGKEVKAGDLLAEIDATVFRAKVDGIRAQLQNQRAQLGDKEAQLVLAKIRVDRQRNLFSDDATTKDALQAAEAGYQSAESQLKALQAQIQQTESSLRAEEANLAYARIYAPMDGTVVSLTSRQGQTLNANQQAPTIMRIADLTTMTVQTQVSEADIGKLSLGMPVYFTTLGGQDYRWYSKLDRIEPTPTVTNNVVLYNALFEVSNDSRVLMTQMSAQVFFITSQVKDSLLIPASALNFQPRKPGEDADKKVGSKKPERKPESDQASAKNSTAIDAEKNGKPAEKPDAEKAVAGEHPRPSRGDTGGQRGDRAGEPNAERKRGPRRAPPAPGEEVKPKPATVQVMDAKGNLSEREILVGISNRVQVQVIEGLQEGETVVSGIRQPEKSTTAASPMGGPGAPVGPNAGGARQMR